MSTDSSPTSQGDTMSTSCGSNQTSTLAASLQQSSITQSMSLDDTPSTKLGSLQVLSYKLPSLSSCLMYSPADRHARACLYDGVDSSLICEE